MENLWQDEKEISEDFASEEVKQRKLKAKEIKRQRFLKRK